MHARVRACVLRADGKRTWFKGSTHARSLWSDGDAAPEVVIARHRERGYQFVCLSEHNILADGSVERWILAWVQPVVPRQK